MRGFPDSQWLERQEEPAPERREDDGKRDTQISALIPVSVCRRVKIALAKDGCTMRELICQRLDEWVAKCYS